MNRSGCRTNQRWWTRIHHTRARSWSSMGMRTRWKPLVEPVCPSYIGLNDILPRERWILYLRPRSRLIGSIHFGLPPFACYKHASKKFSSHIVKRIQGWSDPYIFCWTTLTSGQFMRLLMRWGFYERHYRCFILKICQ